MTESVNTLTSNAKTKTERNEDLLTLMTQIRTQNPLLWEQIVTFAKMIRKTKGATQ